MAAPIASASLMPLLSPTAQAARYLQNYVLLNKTVLEIVGTDVPMIGLARNATERKELLFEQGLTFFLFALLAPFHAALFTRFSQRAFNIPKYLMRLSYQDLTSTGALKEGLAKLPQRLAAEAKEALFPGIKPRPFTPVDFSHIQPTEALRKSLLKAKNVMWTLDLITEGWLLGSVGFAKNKIGQLLSGTKHFTGEMGVVSKETLDELYYQKPKQEKKTTSGMKSLVYILATALPVAIGALNYVSLLKGAQTSGGLGKVYRQVSRFAKHFDHHRGIFISLASLFAVATIYNVGLVAAARSKNELRETIVKKVPMQLTFFLGDLVLIRLMAQRFLKKHNLKPTSHIDQAIKQAPQGLKKLVGEKVARIFWAMFTVNLMLVAGLVVFNNRLTTKRIQQDAGRAAVKNRLTEWQARGVSLQQFLALKPAVS